MMGVRITFHLGPTTISNEGSWLSDQICFKQTKYSEVFSALPIPNECEMVPSYEGKSGATLAELVVACRWSAVYSTEP